jgi:UDP-N-acetylmuramate--alanine ligase
MTTSIDAFDRIHFVGIGGIGMSALAKFLLAKGHHVSGSDQHPGDQGKALTQLGARVVPGHDERNINGAQLIVITSAVPPDNPEVQEAHRRRIPVLKRSELLAEVLNAGDGIAIAGTHGKTTTSALIGHILVEAGLDPTILIGGISFNLGSNARAGEGRIVVAEADEYDASFLKLKPKVGVITNLEPEHLDFYGSVQALHEAFENFIGAIGKSAILCLDDPELRRMSEELKVKVVTFGIDQGQWQARKIRDNGHETLFEVHGPGFSRQCRTQLAGLHNVRNTLAALATSREVGVEPHTAIAAVETFRGVARRFEIKGEAAGVLVMDDYAHHPTEIRASLRAVRQRFGSIRSDQGLVHLIFQPHTYSRTTLFLEDFAGAFGEADFVYLLDIYAARECNIDGISGEDLAVAARRRNSHVAYAETMDAALDNVLAQVKPGDLVITMGAGDVYQLSSRILEELGKR